MLAPYLDRLHFSVPVDWWRKGFACTVAMILLLMATGAICWAGALAPLVVAKVWAARKRASLIFLNVARILGAVFVVRSLFQLQ